MIYSVLIALFILLGYSQQNCKHGGIAHIKHRKNRKNLKKDVLLNLTNLTNETNSTNSTNSTSSNILINSTVPSDSLSNESLLAINEKSTCCQLLHDVYIIQNSQKMESEGASFDSQNYLKYHFGEGDYVTLIHFGGPWSGSVDGYYYSLNHVYQSMTYQGGLYVGQTTYDAALKGAINVLSKFNPERTRINIFSSGLLILQDTQLISKFLDVKAQFEKKTGCPVSIRCIFNYHKAKNNSEAIANVQTFKNICEQIGVSPGLGFMNL